MFTMDVFLLVVVEFLTLAYPVEDVHLGLHFADLHAVVVPLEVVTVPSTTAVQKLKPIRRGSSINNATLSFLKAKPRMFELYP